MPRGGGAVDPTPTLEGIGIDKQLANSAHTAVEVSENIFEEILDGPREEQKAVNASTLTKFRTKHVSHNSGKDE